MHVVRLDPLKRQLAGTGLTEGQKFWYLAGTIVLLGLFVFAGGGKDSDGGSAVGGVLLGLIAAAFAYRRNGGAAGREFLERFMSIGFVVLVRIALILFVIGILTTFVPLVAALFQPLDNLMLYARALSANDNTDFEQIEHAGVALIALPAVLYAAWAVGYHVGQVRQMADGGAAAGPIRAFAATPAGPGPRLPRPAAPTGPRPLDRFVETVIQREQEAAPAAAAPKAGGSLVLHRPPARRSGRLAVHRSTARRPSRPRR